ncbi:homoserine kinase [Halobacillus karajensis]|uniref:Homoserine kinase n=1 Tax=Halobacillus karajensis TaxID=195088 RepID=A0A059NVD0_9BACI|nr:homoserine kinase [Halobacillus karajensis]CDQ18902.1 Homoserine kinase [Halobacillus karajensis]CDQ23025.1 Homoserine kinase [Halobacillus karajensis]CDQ26507.1 Homoserine kinase [Halobacillus karajensis]
MSRFQITVPATSANLGPGFDSVGIALSKFVTLDCQPADEWYFAVPEEDQPYIPSGKSNLIYKTALYTAEALGFSELPPTYVELTNDVPIARGLGSSSTAVVGGIELADHLLQLELSRYEKFKIACEIEGHPDNVGPAIFGGIMVSNYDGEQLDYVHLTEGMKNLTWLAIIPDYHLETEKARGLLPIEIEYKQAVNNSGSANVLVAALATKNWSLAGKMMQSDQWHQPYRQTLIPGFASFQEILRKENSLGHYISGAGPTTIALFDEWDEGKHTRLTTILKDFHIEPLHVNLNGAKTLVLASEK